MGTLRVVQTVHDTVRVLVRDTVVRVAEPQAPDRWVALVSNIAMAAATVVTAWVALLGVRAWRHQVKGETEYRLAIRVFRALLRLRDRIVEAREPFNHLLPVNEGESFKDTPEMVERERKEYWDWMREVIKSTLALKALRPEAEMHWGVEGTRHIDAMDQMARKLRGGYAAYFQHRRREARGEPGFTQVVASDKKIVFNMRVTDEDEDEYGDALSAVVDGAGAFLKHKADLTKLLPRRTP